MKEIIDALAPWPPLQAFVVGMVVVGLGAWAIRRGLQDSQKRSPDIEDEILLRRSHERLENIETNTFDIVKLLEKIADK